MPCCQIPNQNNPVFPPSLIPDAERFSRYVGGERLEQIGDPAKSGVLTSALHLEMKLWKPITFRRPLLENDIESNSWLVMRRRTTAANEVFQRFDAGEKRPIFSLFKLDARRSNCGLIPFDEWVLEMILSLRNQGLAHADLPHPWNPVVHKQPPELATVGLAQKLINIFLKYELCWQVAGRWENEGFVVYAQHRIPNLQHYLCALHAPIDRIVLEGAREKGQEKTDFGLLGTPLGRWLLNSEMIKSNGDLKQSSDGTFRPWSKLDCLRTYYGLQLMLRRVAMNTWPAGCACGGGLKVDPDAAAKALTEECAKWFEKKCGEKHRCGQGQTDWVKAACELPEQVIQETIKGLGLKPCSDSGPGQSKANSKVKSVSSVPNKCRTSGAPASSGQKPVIWLNELSSKNGKPHKSALRLVSDCESKHNLGAICHPHSCLDAKKDLMDMIAQNGGDFRKAGPICREPEPPGETCCWGGLGYVAGIHFNSRADAVRYLKQYFEVRACTGNLQVNQEWIDGC